MANPILQKYGIEEEPKAPPNIIPKKRREETLTAPKTPMFLKGEEPAGFQWAREGFPLAISDAPPKEYAIPIPEMLRQPMAKYEKFTKTPVGTYLTGGEKYEVPPIQSHIAIAGIGLMAAQGVMQLLKDPYIQAKMSTLPGAERVRMFNLTRLSPEEIAKRPDVGEIFKNLKGLKRTQTIGALKERFLYPTQQAPKFEGKLLPYQPSPQAGFARVPSGKDINALIKQFKLTPAQVTEMQKGNYNNLPAALVNAISGGITPTTPIKPLEPPVTPPTAPKTPIVEGKPSLIEEAKKHKSAEEFVATQVKGEIVNFEDIVPTKALNILNRSFAVYSTAEIPEKFYGKITLEKLIDGFAKIGGAEEIVKESNIALQKAGYSKIGNIILTNEGAIPEQQLTDIWNKAQGGMKPPEPPEALPGIQPLPEPIDKLSKNLNIPEESKQEIVNLSNQIKPELENAKGKILSHDEVIEAAKHSDMLRKSISREQTLKLEAELLNTRQHLAALSQEGIITKEFIDTIKNIKAYGTTLGRQLESLKIGAEPALATVKTKLVKHLLDLGKSTDEIVKTLEGIDFNNPQQIIDAYRKLIKPKLSEIIDEYRYINLLSSPKTHIVNTFSNILQTMVLQPMTKAITDIKGVPKYYKGAFTSMPDATMKFIDVMRGKLQVERPDISRIPTNLAVLKPFYAITRLLEASDVFFRTISMGGELAAGTSPEKAIEKSIYYVFRKALDPKNKTGQGDLLSSIDKLTTAIYQLRKVPLVKWFIPFVQTPMNIFKQGVEYSPLGFATLKGAKDKPEQIAKSLIGSIVFLMAGVLALKDKTTWATPKGKKAREAFYSAGMQPYSIKVGDKWISYSRIGPLAFPIAMAAAIRYHTSQSVKSVSDSDLQKITKSIQGISEFFADQSYLEGLGNFVDLVRGDTSASSRILLNIPTQLIPLSSLQRWVANLIDPVYRKTERQLSLQAIKENLMKGIPGLSKQLTPYTNKIGQPSERVYSILNALVPTQVTKTMPRGERAYQQYIEQKKREEKVKSTAYDWMKSSLVPKQAGTQSGRNPILEKYGVK